MDEDTTYQMRRLKFKQAQALQQTDKAITLAEEIIENLHVEEALPFWEYQLEALRRLQRQPKVFHWLLRRKA